MSGPLPKTTEKRQRRNAKTSVLVSFPGAKQVQAPPMPKDLLAVTKTLWRAFWASPMAGMIEPGTDMAVVIRLFGLYDERERSYRAYRRSRLILGSQGQKVLNPMGRAMQDFDSEIRQLEDRLGMSP